MIELKCFKANDIRGKLGLEFNEEIAYRIGRAYGEYFKPKKVVVGGDVRLTSEAIKNSVTNGLRDCGVNVLDIGLAGTEEIYFSTFHLQLDGGIEVTASHNPEDFNGIKLVRELAVPVSMNSGLSDIKKIAEENSFPCRTVLKRGQYKKISIINEYVDYLLTFIDFSKFKNTLKIVVNSGNGAAGHVIDQIEKRFRQEKIPIEFIKINHHPDGNFPNGIPNPLLSGCRTDTKQAVLEHQANLGIAFDGDFDRCFLFDEEGIFIESYYLVGFIAQALLAKYPSAKIVHDPRLVWNTQEIVNSSGGIPVMSLSGHSFFKDVMRKENAIYGGEISGHHYFRDFSYCDSGMIPWLIIAEMLSQHGGCISEYVAERRNKYLCSDEINYSVNNADALMDKIIKIYESKYDIDRFDGVSVSSTDWRFNLRASNTESVVRLNIESKKGGNLVENIQNEIEKIIMMYA